MPVDNVVWPLIFNFSGSLNAIQIKDIRPYYVTQCHATFKWHPVMPLCLSVWLSLSVHPSVSVRLSVLCSIACWQTEEMKNCSIQQIGEASSVSVCQSFSCHQVSQSVIHSQFHWMHLRLLQLENFFCSLPPSHCLLRLPINYILSLHRTLFGILLCWLFPLSFIQY